MSQQLRSTAGSRATEPSAEALLAGVFLAIAGVLGILQGISAIAKDSIYAHVSTYVFKFNLTAWGWGHLVIGVLVLAVSFGVFTGAGWARLTALFLVSLNLIENFLWLPYEPWWALVAIGLDVFIIWALTGKRQAAT